MAFKDYFKTPADNTALGDGTYIGPDMLRNKVRPALQQIAADGKDLADTVQDRIDLAKGDPGGDGSLIPKFTLIVSDGAASASLPTSTLSRRLAIMRPTLALRSMFTTPR
jgi:hypothetical protein